jgi:ubiquinone/menaquinone biosynthesis C-methylase UbiE
MDSSLNQFNRIAGSYDLLASLVFAGNIHKAQLTYLHLIPPQAKVLILGGGTGKILNDLFKLNPSAQVYYVEASDAMIERAKKNSEHFKTHVHFIHGTANSIPDAIQFDVVITSFFLDMFSSPAMDDLIQQVAKSLERKSIWIVTDFVNSKKKLHQALLRMMYLFFRTFCGIEAQRLPDWENQLKNAGFGETKRELFYDGFIKSALYRYPE